MDLRRKKTIRAIKNAYLQLRSKKDLEKITVTELTNAAEISKATFYLHYHDIYELAEELEQEVLKDVINSIPETENMLRDTSSFTEELVKCIHSQINLISLVFSGSRSNILPESLDNELYRKFCEHFPSLKTDISFRLQLSYTVYGAYNIYSKYKNSADFKQISAVIKQYAQPLSLITNQLSARGYRSNM